jgi:hypothetical protein
MYLSGWIKHDTIHCHLSKYGLCPRTTANRGIPFDSDFILKSRAKPRANAEIFAEYIPIVFLPNLNELQTFGESADEEAIFLMDNCPSYVAEASTKRR